MKKIQIVTFIPLFVLNCYFEDILLKKISSFFCTFSMLVIFINIKQILLWK